LTTYDVSCTLLDPLIVALCDHLCEMSVNGL